MAHDQTVRQAAAEAYVRDRYPNFELRCKSLPTRKSTGSLSYSVGAGVSNLPAGLLQPMLEKYGYGNSAIEPSNTNGLVLTLYDIGVPAKVECVNAPGRSHLVEFCVVMLVAVIAYLVYLVQFPQIDV